MSSPGHNGNSSHQKRGRWRERWRQPRLPWWPHRHRRRHRRHDHSQPHRRHGRGRWPRQAVEEVEEVMALASATMPLAVAVEEVDVEAAVEVARPRLRRRPPLQNSSRASSVWSLGHSHRRRPSSRRILAVGYRRRQAAPPASKRRRRQQRRRWRRRRPRTSPPTFFLHQALRRASGGRPSHLVSGLRCR